jgi:hypothetical protein
MSEKTCMSFGCAVSAFEESALEKIGEDLPDFPEEIVGAGESPIPGVISEVT